MSDRLAGKEYYCFLNGYSDYNQIAIALEDQQKTTFTCPYGTFAFKRMHLPVQCSSNFPEVYDVYFLRYDLANT